MLNFMKLELRKHRFLFYGIAGAFFATIAFSALLSLTNEVPMLQFMALTAMAWAGPGLMFMPLLYGATSGAALRAEPVASAEAGLPVSPGRKVAGALAAMGLYLLGLAAVFGAVTIALSPFLDGGGTTHLEAGAWSPLFEAEGFIPLLVMAVAGALAAIVMLLASFTLAYATRHSILGGLVGGLLSGVLFAGLFIGIWCRLQLFTGEPALAALLGAFGGAAVIPLLAAGGLFVALRGLAAWGERRVKPGATGWALIGAGLLCGTTAAVGWMGAGYRDFTTRLIFIESDDPGQALLPGARAAARSTALFATRDGALIGVTDDGRRTVLLPEDRRSPGDLLENPQPGQSRVRSVAWADDGSLWVLTRGELGKSADSYELWHGDAQHPLKSHAFFKAPAGMQPYRLAHRGTQLGVVAWTEGARSPNQFALLPPPAKAPQFEPLGSVSPDGKYDEDRELLAAFADAGLLADASPDGRALQWKSGDGTARRCEYPEGALAAGTAGARPSTLHEAGGWKYFLRGVTFPDGSKAAAICALDGTARIEWRGAVRPGYLALDDDSGQVFIGGTAGRIIVLFAVTSTGRFLPPFTYDDAQTAQWTGASGDLSRGFFQPIRFDGTRALLLNRTGWLLKVDLENGALLKRWQLPGRPWFSQYGASRYHDEDAYFPANEQGFTYTANGRLYRAGFDGTTRDLGPARLD